VWFQELQFDGGTKPVTDPNLGGRLLVGSDGNPLAFFTVFRSELDNAKSGYPTYLVKLKKSDGALTPWH